MTAHLVPSIQLVTSGLPALDEKLGGLPTGALALVQGPPRSGKTWCALAFAAEALVRGERCLYVSSDDPDALCAFAERSLGFDVRRAIGDGNFVLLNPGQWFTHKLRSLGGAERALDELGKLVWSRGIDNVVFDSFDVVLAAAELAWAKRFVRGALAALEKLSATCLITSLGPWSAELALAAQEVAAGVSTVIALDGQPCTTLSVLASWTGDEEIAVEMLPGFGPVTVQAPQVAARDARGERTKVAHLRAV